MRLSPADLDDIRARHALADVAGRKVALRARAGAQRFAGPCPICGGSPGNQRFEIDGARWVCAVCSDGGDVIRLVERMQGCDFKGALAFLGEDHRLSRPQSPEERAASDARIAQERQARTEAEQRRMAEEAETQARKMERLKRLAREAEPVRMNSTGAQYLAGRAIDAKAALLAGLRLALHPSLTYQGPASAEERKAIGAMPTLVASLRDAEGSITGFHFTALRCEAGRWKKAQITLPDGREMPKSVMAGTKSGSAIRLIGPPQPHTLILAEGIETALSIFTALARAGLWTEGHACHAAGDLGNMAGRAIDRTEHPLLRDDRGRPKLVPGIQPDFGSACAPVPDSVTRLILAGDGDSERLLTGNALSRAASRHRREGRVIQLLMAPAGKDWNDVLQESQNG